MKVVISPNPYRDKQFRYAQKVKSLIEECGCTAELCLPFEVDKNFELPADVKLSKISDALNDCEVFICLGGDGTILHASRLVSQRGIPILGINIGTLGFMAELEYSDISLLSQIPQKNWQIEERMMLKVSVISDGKVVFTDYALNDAVITKGAVARVLQMNVFCNDSEIFSCSGDGIILATPTGSTAYSLSAGGPIVEPTAQNILITPICAHGLNFNSILTDDTRKVSVTVDKVGRRSAFLSVDGGRAFRLEANDTVVVEKSDRVTRLVHLKEKAFFQTIHKKFYNR